MAIKQLFENQTSLISVEYKKVTGHCMRSIFRVWFDGDY
jgi:hypothetical protein